MGHLVSAVGALGFGSLFGVLLGAWLNVRRDREQRRADFCARQISEFYGPMLSMRAEIQARGKLRVEIGNAAGAAWREGAAYAQKVGIQASQKYSQHSMPAFAALNEDENGILREVLMPLYRAMLTLFRDRMWLAEPQTREHFPAFLAFVDVWERWLRETIPGEVIRQMGHSEEKLHPFYDHLTQTHDRLQQELRTGQRPTPWWLTDRWGARPGDRS